MKFLVTLIGSVSIGFLSLIASVQTLNCISIARSGIIGPGGGFSVGIFGLFSSLVLTVWLLITTTLMWNKTRGTSNSKWPIGRGQMVAILAWGFSVAALAFKIYKL